MRFEKQFPSLAKLRRGKSAEGKAGSAVPAPLRDLYGDLRDRRLLPLLGFLLVAIVAVPFLLGGKDDFAVPPPADLGATDVGAAEAGESLVVVEATPGLRDYKQRLNGRQPRNPFAQQYTTVPQSAKLEATTIPSAPDPGPGPSGTEEPEIGLPPISSPPSAGGGDKGKGKNKDKGKGSDERPRGRLFGYRPEVRFGIAGSNDLTLYKELPLGKLLPNKRPVVVFMGISENGQQALFSVAREVAVVRGDGRCIGGNRNCGLLILKEGEAVDLLTGRPNRDFRLKVMKIEFVELEEMTKANTSSEQPAARLGLAHSFSK